jgi:TATA-box binding protein (TBP) (component of TFIID and TFIIIB)
MESVELFNEVVESVPGLSVSVITVCANLNSRINIPKKDSEKKGFNNCFITKIEYNESTNISVKIFVNGKLQITGCKTIETAHAVPQIMHDTLLSYYPQCIENKETYNVSDVKIGMINSNFKVGHKLNLPEVQQKLVQSIKNGLYQYSSYQPDKYCAINLKCHKGVSVFIFSSGSVNITGAKNAVDLKEAYEKINCLLVKQ